MDNQTDKPTADSLMGSDPDFTGGLESAAYVRHLRGGTLDSLMALRATLAAIVERQKGRSDIERDHGEVDRALIAYIDDPEVTRLFDELDLWYA